jgi:hypothetical protein
MIHVPKGDTGIPAEEKCLPQRVLLVSLALLCPETKKEAMTLGFSVCENAGLSSTFQQSPLNKFPNERKAEPKSPEYGAV